MRGVRWLLLVVLAMQGGCVAGQQTEASHEVAFVCDDGGTLAVRFFPGRGVAMLVLAEGRRELVQKPSASGFWYANDSDSIRGKGDELVVESSRAAPRRCVASK